MNDADLFALGCGVTFIALCGAYVYLRERFLDGTRRPAARTRPVRNAPRRPGEVRGGSARAVD